MMLSDKAEKYLEILIEYSKNIYTKSIAKLPPGTKLVVRDEDNKPHVNDLVIEACDQRDMVMSFTGMRLFHH